jgi:hypothetical protein
MKNKYLLIFLGFIFILFIVAFTTYDPFQNFFDKNWLGLTQLAVALISIFTGLYVSNLQQASAKKTLELNQFKEKFKICEAVETLNSLYDKNLSYDKSEIIDFWIKIQSAKWLFNTDLFSELQKYLYIFSCKNSLYSNLPFNIEIQVIRSGNCLKKLKHSEEEEEEEFRHQYLHVKKLLDLSMKK